MKGSDPMATMKAAKTYSLRDVLEARTWVELAEKADLRGSPSAFYWAGAANAYVAVVRATPHDFDTSRGMYAINALRAARQSGDESLFAALAEEFSSPDAHIGPFSAQVIAGMVRGAAGPCAAK